MDDKTLIALFISLIVLLMLSAFFSATETAFTSMNTVRMKHLATTKKSAQRVLKMHANYDKILSTTLIGNNIVNIASASIATVVFTHYWGNAGVTASTIIMTVAVLIFGEISPKSLSKERPEAVAMALAIPLFFFYIIFMPLNYFFSMWKKFLKKVFRLSSDDQPMTEDEFKIIVGDIKDGGVITDAEHNIISNTLKYDETLVSSVMIPVENTIMLDINTPQNEIKQVLKEKTFSRIPIFEDDKNNIVGILHRADFYEMLLDGGELKPMLKEVVWVEPDEPISMLFSRFQKTRQHIAMVGTSSNVCGLITMEDILEEIMGEIKDENDPE